MKLMARWFVEKIAYAATFTGFKLGRVAVRALPRPWLFSLSDGLATLAFFFVRGYRTRSIANVSAAFAGCPASRNAPAIVRGALKNFFRACVEMVIAMESSDEERRAAIAVEGFNHLEAAVAKGKGVIVLSAHLGNFFLVGTRLAIEGYAVHILINQPHDIGFAELLDDLRSEIRIFTIHARPRREALRALSGVLRHSGIVVMIADEYRKGNGVPTKLFGRTVLARRGPVTIASRTGAALVPACVVRQPDKSLRLIIEPEIPLIRPGVRQGEGRENAQRMTQWVERTVRAHPDQWNWFNIRWWEDGNQRPETGDRRSEVGGQT
jgi:KDO2-lipid IV(A) lauroyltransferase